MRSLRHHPSDGPCAYCADGVPHDLTPPRAYTPIIPPKGMYEHLPEPAKVQVVDPVGRGLRISLRHTLMLRDGPMCHYCGADYGSTIEHVVPRSLGGPLIEDNTALACPPCNNNRGNKNEPHEGCAFCAEARRRYGHLNG